MVHHINTGMFAEGFSFVIPVSWYDDRSLPPSMKDIIARAEQGSAHLSTPFLVGSLDLCEASKDRRPLLKNHMKGKRTGDEGKITGAS